MLVMSVMIMIAIVVVVVVMVSPICVAERVRSRVVTSVTHTTQIHHRLESFDTDSMSYLTDQDIRDNTQKMKRGHALEAVKKELCTDIPSRGLLEEASISVPYSTSSNFFVNILINENLTFEELSSCLVIESAGPSPKHRDFTECGQVIHRKWRSKKTNSDVLDTETLHFTFNVLDKDPDEVLPHWLEFSSGSSKVCVGWSHFEEESEGARSVNLTLVQRKDYFSDLDDSSFYEKTSPPRISVTETKEAASEMLSSYSNAEKLTKDIKLISVSSLFFGDSRDVAATTYSLATNNVPYVSRTVSVNSLVDSAPNASLCTLTSSDQQLSSSLIVTNGDCNFRSAIETCTLFLSSDSCVDVSATACVVLLPPMQTIIIDPVFGEVMIADDSICGSLSLEGNGCVIHPSSSTSLSMRLLNVDLPVPSDGWFSLHINNLVIMNFRSSSVEGGAIRLNNLKSNYLSSITNVIFRNNSGSNGGALAIGNSQTMVLRGNVFEGNTARGDAGGLLIHSDCENINITGCSFNYNTALGKVNSKSGFAGFGGGAMINTRNSLISFRNCSFFHNFGIRGGGLGVYDSNDHISLYDVSFSNNTADYIAGGMYAANDNIYMILTRCNFLGNIGMTDTGGFRIYTGNYYTTVLYCNFSGNSAMGEGGNAGGGGVSLYDDNRYFMLKSCILSDNSVSSSEGRRALGGGVFLNADNLYFTLQDCHLSGNSASSTGGGSAHGGGIYLVNDNDYFTLQNSNLYGNSVSNSDGGDALGGGIYLNTNNWYLKVQGCNFSGNSATSVEGYAWGGGVYMFSSNRNMIMRDSSLSNNIADIGGSLCLDAGNLYATLHNVTCRDNVARDNGGGVALISGNYYFILSESSLIGNTAGTRGGGIYSALLNNDLQLTHSDVRSNSALSAGGGVYIGENHERVYFADMDFSDNTALETAGGVYFARFSSDVVLSDCKIRNNSAGTVGGLLVLVDDMLITSSVVEHNVAKGDYGAIYVESSKSLEVISSNFSHNAAQGNCGAISVSQTESVMIKFSIFFSNSARTGGAVCVTNESKNTSFINTNFNNNVASVSAGALFVMNAFIVIMEFSLFSYNIALSGDGSAIYIFSSRVFLESSSFSGNSALLGGGTVFWASSSDMQEPSGLTGSEAGNYFSLSNTARYGSWYATEARYIVSTKYISSLQVIDYSKQVAPPITVFIQDWYNQTVLSDSSSYVTVSVSTSLNSDCYGEEGFIGGLTRLTLLNGSLTYDYLEPVCAPSYNLSLDVASSLPSVASLLFQYSFRACVTGEYYAGRICQPCEIGSFSFINPETVNMSDLTQASTCQSCMSEAESCYGDMIILKKNYWRISRDSTDIFECPYHDACNGGRSTGDVSCAEGHEGPVCGVCSTGYTFSQTALQCVPCNSEKSRFSFFNVIVLIFILMMILLSAHSLYTFRMNKTVRDLDDYQLYLLVRVGFCSLNDFESNRDVLRIYLVNWRSRLEQIFKTYIILFQILSVLPFVLHMDFPTSFQVMSSVLNFFNLKFSTSSIMTCSANGSYDYFTRLVIDTLYPAVILLLLVVVNRIHFYCRTNNFTGSTELTTSNSRIYSVAIIFTSLILPGISVSIFGVFSCQEFDSEDTVAGEDIYMTQDLSISCTSQRYSNLYLYAVLMIFVYPIGIPLSYLYVLYQAKSFIMFPDQPVGSREEEIHRTDVLKAIKKLHIYYKPEFWYWEVVEVSYRISLTGLLILIKPGSSFQILIGLCLSVMFLKVNEIASPFVDLDAQQLKNTSLYQIVGIFCIAILVKGELFSDEYYLSVASVVLLTWNIGAYIFVVSLSYCWRKWLQYFQSSRDPLREIALTKNSTLRNVDLENVITDCDSKIQAFTRNPLSNTEEVKE